MSKYYIPKKDRAGAIFEAIIIFLLFLFIIWWIFNMPNDGLENFLPNKFEMSYNKIDKIIVLKTINSYNEIKLYIINLDKIVDLKMRNRTLFWTILDTWKRDYEIKFRDGNIAFNVYNYILGVLQNENVESN